MADRLEPQTVVDKAEPNERMAGLPLARADSSVGTWVLTLYRRPSGVPFVHALMANSLYAFCIDLPAAARVDVADPPSWGIEVRGRTLYVANAATGFVAAVDMGTLKVVQHRLARCPAGDRGDHATAGCERRRHAPLPRAPTGPRLARPRRRSQQGRP